MAERDSFIDEVSEELRRDRMLRLWKRWGPWVIAALVVAVGAAAVSEWLESREESQAREAGAALIGAAGNEEPAARAEAFAGVAADREGGPAMVAELSQAAALVEAGEREAAAELLERVQSDGTLAPVYRELAGFKAAMLREPDLDPQARAEAMSAFAAEGAPFRLMALERRAAAYIAAGEMDAAREDVAAALASPDLSPSLRQRLQQMAQLVGGIEG